MRNPADQEVLASLGWAVERGRRRMGLSQRELASIVGCATSTIWRIERGVLRPSTILLVRIAEAVGGLTIGDRDSVKRPIL